MFWETVPYEIKKVMETLNSAGHHAYLVGGCVRDYLMGNRPHDYDVCSDAQPYEVHRACYDGFDVLNTGVAFGTVTVMSGDTPVEVTTFRSENGYTDGRHPDNVEYVKNIETDLARRDFTINAMAYDSHEFVDPFGGMRDLSNGVIRAVGDPDARFKEDGLRILRAIRFAVKYGFMIEDKTFEAMIRNKECLQNCSKERITAEFKKIFETDKPVTEVFMKAHEIIFEIVPELVPCYKFDQNNKYHKHDVYEHMLAVTDACPAGSSFEIKMAALLHDIGKPASCTTDEQGQSHFYGHPEESAKIAKEVLSKDFRVSNAEYDRIIGLVENHDMYLSPTEKSVKRALNKFGEDFLRDFFVLKQADIDDHIFPTGRTGAGAWGDISRQIELFHELLEKQACFTIKDLAVNGSDVMETLHLKPGKEVGEVLNHLLQEVIDGNLENDRFVLLEAVTKELQSNSLEEEIDR